jgi:hypothetical protein
MKKFIDFLNENNDPISGLTEKTETDIDSFNPVFAQLQSLLNGISDPEVKQHVEAYVVRFIGGVSQIFENNS